MLVLQGQADCYVNNTAGTKRWDTCAGEALIRAFGGTLTDVNGAAYRYVPAAHEHLVNQNGIIAALHAPHAARAQEAVSHCTTTADITRDPDGKPIDVAWLRANVRVPHAELIASFDAPEESAVRSRHSHVVKLHLRYRAADLKSVDESSLVRVLLLKRCVARDLSARAPEKLARDVKSYANEANFVRELSALLHDEGGVHVASPYYTFTDVHSDDPTACRFLTIVESLENFEQFSFLDFSRACAALDQLARFHAFFLQRDDARLTAQRHLWQHGGHWDTDKIPHGSAEIAKTDEDEMNRGMYIRRMDALEWLLQRASSLIDQRNKD
ncbi:hypothetical protein PTSG_10229 [Salpingoeca rosetta]|uniref:3'(2'),5'-bisphosphate nucleotidase 1 n=1 Tax=Salpingoeca rosetta (strain ATCC 50818 / BSB-021) TaxID=946362 RepID=F2UQP2_SALR5|nr:uncharacterized protein PTSG_10229 [Salpingoeca rosetta]EGD79947.1 hypothetical protein PTSG_10229 [Salpingoeca rosetta]|eukprot:XP_004988568.1 hypothetical protein PTSG_10229 [Salpingoeca rosetta]